MNDLKDIIKSYKKIGLTIEENELVIKKQKQKKQEYEEQIISLLKKYELTNKPIHLKDTELIYKCENKPCSLSQKYLEESINDYFNERFKKILGNKHREESYRFYKYIIENRPKKMHERLHEKKSK